MTSKFSNDGRVFDSIPSERLMTTSGLELMREMIAGELPSPPMSKLMNFRLCEIGEGIAVFRGHPLKAHYNPAGVVHGGWAGTIMDSALGCCVWSQVPLGKAYTTAEFKVHLVRPITDQTGEVICEARVIHMGRKIATSEGTLKTVDGKLLAHGSETCAVYDPKE